MVKKFITTSQAAVVADHKLPVHNNTSTKVLKPKVFITDSSSFKNLVQELTGNGTIGSSVSSPSVASPPCVITSEPFVHEQIHLVRNDSMYSTIQDYGFQKSSMESSFVSWSHHIGLVNLPDGLDSPPCSAVASKLIDHEQALIIQNNMMYSTVEDYVIQESGPESSFDSLDHHISLTAIPVEWNSPSYAITSKPVGDHELQVIQNNIICNIENFDYQESSPELSYDYQDYGIPVMFDYSQEIINHNPTTFISKDQEFQSSWEMMTFPLQYEEMESSFLETDPSVYSNCYLQGLQTVTTTPEICVFDYDLSAIL